MKYYDKNATILLSLIGTNMMDNIEFSPYVKYLQETDWYKKLIIYCISKNIDYNKKFRSFCELGEYLIGVDLFIVPKVICKIDILDNTEKYKKYKEVLNLKID